MSAPMRLFDNDIFYYLGKKFVVRFPLDPSNEPPWERGDGYGPVRQTTFESYKRPGERPMNKTGRRDRYLYDWEAATVQAKREGWGLSDADLDALRKRLGREPTKKQIRREAVQKDFEFLAGWVNDEWTFIGVEVTLVEDKDFDNDHDEASGLWPSNALWGIESCSEDYIVEVATDLASEVLYKHLGKFAYEALRCIHNDQEVKKAA